MAENGTVITNQGLRLLADAQTGVKIEFTKVVFGDGFIDGELEEVTSLVSPKLESSIQSITVTGDGQSVIRVLISNQSVDAGFFIREIAIYAKDKNGIEFPYSIVYYGDKATWLRPRGSAEIVEYMHDLITIVGNAENVTAVINESFTVATKEDLSNLITFSQTVPINPSPNSLWIKNLGEVSNPPVLSTPGEFIIANAVFSSEEPEDRNLIWFETEKQQKWER